MAVPFLYAAPVLCSYASLRCYPCCRGAVCRGGLEVGDGAGGA